jgi:hypothetical protein
MTATRRPRQAAACLNLALLLVAFLSHSGARGWDSQAWNPTHATHSYLTEWAIDQLKGQFPEA